MLPVTDMVVEIDVEDTAQMGLAVWQMTGGFRKERRIAKLGKLDAMQCFRTAGKLTFHHSCRSRNRNRKHRSWSSSSRQQ